MFEMKVKCPRCGAIHTIRQGSPGVLCNCHLVCPYGDKPSDCNVTEVNFKGDLAWPTGLHVDAEQEGDDVMHITYYCSVHDVYYYKTPVWIEADWERWFSRRAPEWARMSHKKY